MSIVSEKQSHKKMVVELLKSIESGNSDPVTVVNPKRYIQHNLAIADGLAGFGAALQQLPKGSARVNTVRVFQDGDYVFTHTDYDFFGPKVGFDIFRFQDDKIVEHWDNLQDKPSTANSSGHTMIDGSTASRDLEKTETNKALVRAFVEDILLNGRMEKISGYFDGDSYVQHNPQIGDGLSGLGVALEALKNRGVTMQYDRIHRVLGEGDFVLVVSEGKLAGEHTSYYDLFRVANGRIVEHWDTIETILPEEKRRHANGKF